MPSSFSVRMSASTSCTTVGARPSEGSSNMISSRLAHQAAADGEHLLLAARQRAGGLVRALAPGAGTSRTPSRSVRAARRRGRAAAARPSRGSRARSGSGTPAGPRRPGRCRGRRSRWLRRPAMSRPSKRIVPARGVSMPAMVRISEVLPAPLAPTMATISPCRHLERHADRAPARRRRTGRGRARSAWTGSRIASRLLAEVALEHAPGSRTTSAGRALRDDLAVVQHDARAAPAPSPRASRARSAGW